MKPRLFPNHRLSGPLLAAVLCQPAAWAANITWDGDTSTDWSNAANWTGGVVPANNITGDAAVFSAVSPLNQPSVSGAVSVTGIDVQLAAGGWSLGGAGTLTLGDKGIDATSFASGTITIGVADIVMGSSTSSTWGLGVSANANVQATVVELTSNIQLHKAAQLQLNSPRGGSGGTGTFNVKGLISNTIGEATSGQLKYLGGSAVKNTFNVTGANTYTGNTLISQAVVNVNSLADEGTASALGSSGTINIVENTSFGTLAYSGTQAASTNRRVTVGGSFAGNTGNANIDNNATNAAHTLSLTNSNSIIAGGTGNRTVALRGTNTGSNSFAPLIENATSGLTSLRKEQAGKWAIANTANTYTGETSLIGGTLEAGVLADSGTASSLGSGGVIRFNGGTLLYNGAGSSSNRTLEIGPSTGSGSVTAKIQANGNGALSLTAATMNYGTVNELRTLSLGGTSTQDNTFATAITNNGTAATAVAKADAGRWILSGTNNTFTGGLNLSGGGRLIFGGDGALGASSGAVTFSGSSDLVATQGATIGSGRTITLSGSSAASFGITSAAGTTLDIAAKITGTGSVNRLSGSSSTTGVVRYSNPANDFTGDFNTRFGVVEFGSVANAGSASTIGAGSQVGISNGNSASVLRHVGGAGSSTNRNLVWTGGTGPLALESSGSGAIQWLGTGVLVGAGASSGAKTLTLGGSNTGLNELAQPINDTPAGGATSLVKGGAGTWRISGISSHTGSSTVESGKLLVDGNISTSDLSVATGAILGGSGTVGTTSISGIHSPGNSPGVQTVSNLTYLDGARIVWELVDDLLSGRGTSHDGIDVTGDLVFSGSTTVELDFASVGSGVDWTDSLWDNSISGINGWKVFDLTSGTISGFANLSIGGAPWLDGQGDSLGDIRPNASFSLVQDGNDIYLNYANASAIPEPGGVLGLGALLGAGLLQRRRRPTE